MTKEQCSLQPNYYGSSCDFQDLQSAVQQLTTKSDAQFEELKNEKWFHRIFNMVVCPRKNNIRMAEQITSLAQAQGILIEILVRLADQDANIAGMVMQSQSDIRALAQNSAYLQERLYLLEDKNKDAMGTVSNCTFTNMGNCISGMDTVTNCVFDGCSYAVDTCGYEVKECRFHNCAWACQRLFGQAVVSNCQFVDCKGETLITSDYNAEIKVEDCEFSNIRLVEDGFTYYFRSMIVFSTVDTKFANAGRWSEVNRCIFNGICISRKSNRTSKSDEHAYVICAQVTSVDKFKFARARVADCTFTNCASVNSKLINTEPYDSLFGKKHNYMAVSSRNNSGLNDIGDPSSFVASSNVKLKETDANGNKIGSSLSVN